MWIVPSDTVNVLRETWKKLGIDQQFTIYYKGTLQYSLEFLQGPALGLNCVFHPHLLITVVSNNKNLTGVGIKIPFLLNLIIINFKFNLLHPAQSGLDKIKHCCTLSYWSLVFGIAADNIFTLSPCKSASKLSNNKSKLFTKQVFRVSNTVFPGKKKVDKSQNGKLHRQ